jgi:hypothetical protein
MALAEAVRVAEPGGTRVDEPGGSGVDEPGSAGGEVPAPLEHPAKQLADTASGMVSRPARLVRARMSASWASVVPGFHPWDSYGIRVAVSRHRTGLPDLRRV